MSVSPFGINSTIQLPSGSLISYAEITANVSVTATTEGGATLIVTAPSFVADGTSSYWVEFFCPQLVAANADFCVFVIYDNAAFLTRMGTFAGVTNVNGIVTPRRKLNGLAAGVHAIDVRGLRGAANATVSAGTGLTGALPPAYVAVYKA